MYLMERSSASNSTIYSIVRGGGPDGEGIPPWTFEDGGSFSREERHVEDEVVVAGEEEKGTEVLEEALVSEDWGRGGASCLEDLAAERRRREVQEGVLGGGGTRGGRGGLFRRILKSRTTYT